MCPHHGLPGTGRPRGGRWSGRSMTACGHGRRRSCRPSQGDEVYRYMNSWCTLRGRSDEVLQDRREEVGVRGSAGWPQAFHGGAALSRPLGRERVTHELPSSSCVRFHPGPRPLHRPHARPEAEIPTKATPRPSGKGLPEPGSPSHRRSLRPHCCHIARAGRGNCAAMRVTCSLAV